jgi:hypothetical protein
MATIAADIGARKICSDLSTFALAALMGRNSPTSQPRDCRAVDNQQQLTLARHAPTG